jgi:glycosyltransferase involved in cell wall biosynthesis
MSRRRLLMATSNYWHSPFQVGSHQLARAFVQEGWEVGFVSDPLSPFHLAGAGLDDVRRRYDIYSAGGRTDCGGRLWTYVPGALLTPNNKPLLSAGWVARGWPRLSRPSLAQVLRRNGFGSVDLLYCDSVVHLAWMQECEHRKSLYRVNDNLAGFAKSTPAVLALERDMARWVDLVVYTARSLEDHVKGLMPKRMAYLPNGVNYGHFSAGIHAVPVEYRSMRRPIALYVGAMDTWFDFQLMDEVASRLPAVSFVLIGPNALAKQRFQQRRNVHLLGPRRYTDLPPYMHHADVGLIPFDVGNHEKLVRSIHPLKLYEYLASGLPVVAVEWEELTYLNSPALLCRGTDAFVLALERAIAEPPDKAELQHYASLHDWGRRVDAICSSLEL